MGEAESCAQLGRAVQIWDLAVERVAEVSGPEARRLVRRLTQRHPGLALRDRRVHAPVRSSSGEMLGDPMVLRLDGERWWLRGAAYLGQRIEDLARAGRRGGGDGAGRAPARRAGTHGRAVLQAAHAPSRAIYPEEIDGPPLAPPVEMWPPDAEGREAGRATGAAWALAQGVPVAIAALALARARRGIGPPMKACRPEGPRPARVRETFWN